MSLHKLTAGDGYTYLTRQVAACDATHRGRDALSDYYSEKGESPGVWLGHGADGLSQFLAPTETPTATSPPGRGTLLPPPAATATAPPAAVAGVGEHVATGMRLAGRQVGERQMLALFGEGRHPDAEAIEKHLIAVQDRQRPHYVAHRAGPPLRAGQRRCGVAAGLAGPGDRTGRDPHRTRAGDVHRPVRAGADRCP